MFSGIVETTGEVAQLSVEGDSAELRISNPIFKETKLGDSIAISGVCLTVSKLEGELAHFDVSSETLRKTTLRNLTKGSVVNLERALRVGSRLDGHMVLGHADGVLELLFIEKESDTLRFEFSIPEGLGKYIVAKGSVCIDGVSLTVGEVGEKSFSVYLIPHTAEVTTFGKLNVGVTVNFEIDTIARYLEGLLRKANA